MDKYKVSVALLLFFPLIFVLICLKLSYVVENIQNNRLLRPFPISFSETNISSTVIPTHAIVHNIAGFDSSYLNASIEKFKSGRCLEKRKVIAILNASHSQHSKLPNVIHVSVIVSSILVR